MKKVLAGFIMDGRSGGIDRYLLNFYHTVQGSIRVDFLTNEIDKRLEAELGQQGSRLYAIPSLHHPAAQYRLVRRILREGGYDAVYLNISTAIDSVAAIAAAHEGIPERLIHSHSSGNDCESALRRNVFNLIHSVCRTFLWRYGTRLCGCSVKAGEWMFPRKIVHSRQFEVIYNAVDRKKYEYDEAVREEMRKELALGGRFTIGHVGNFCYQKNHGFLLEVFAELLKKIPDACLLLAGDGVRFEDMKKRAADLGIADAVKFLGRRTDADRLYQAMDAFLLPSNFEGLPIAGIEAQSAGLPCYMSDTITKESRITEDCRFLSFKDGAAHWANVIAAGRKERGRARYLDNASDYDLANQQKQLRELL